MFSLQNGRIVFLSDRAHEEVELYTMIPDGSDVRRLTDNIVGEDVARWSPDGKWIAYTSGDMANYDIWMINLESGERTRLTTLAKRDETPIWIRDLQKCTSD